MASEQFKMGDVVRLKSGGPRMTVVGTVKGGDWLICNWFEGDTVHTGTFPSSALESAPETQEPETRPSDER